MTACTCDCKACKNCVDKQPAPPETEKVAITLWLNSSIREDYINFYKDMLDNYEKTVSLVYSNIKERYEIYQKEVYEELLKTRAPEDIDTHDIGSEAHDRMERDLLMHYQYHFSQLVNLYHTFEQHIRKHLYEELNHRLSPVRTSEVMREFATKFGDIKEYLKLLNYPLGATGSWQKIVELNKIANTYKHGDGTSAQRLDKTFFVSEATRLFNYVPERTRQEESGYVRGLTDKEKERYEKEKSELLLERELSTNQAIVLRHDKTPFDLYVTAIMEFWRTFPEHLNSVITVKSREEELVKETNE